MLETLKMMSKMVTKELKATSDFELIKEYQLTFNPAILATLFKRHFGQINIICDHFSYFTSEDKASICLEKLDQCMINFNFKNKFLTYFHTCLYNELRSLSQRESGYKSKANYESSSYEAMLDLIGYDAASCDTNCLDQLTLDAEKYEITKYLESLDLTDRELRYCDLILDNFGSNALIAEKLGVCAMTLSNLRKSLRDKTCLQLYVSNELYI